jgi:hypothetical protein
MLNFIFYPLPLAVMFSTNYALAPAVLMKAFPAIRHGYRGVALIWLKAVWKGTLCFIPQQR